MLHQCKRSGQSNPVYLSNGTFPGWKRAMFRYALAFVLDSSASPLSLSLTSMKNPSDIVENVTMIRSGVVKATKR